MGTRAMVNFFGRGKVEAKLYLHWDGYPDGRGVDLMYFLRHLGNTLTEGSSGPRFSHPEYLAAKYVVWSAAGWWCGEKRDTSTKVNEFDFLGVGVSMQDHGDIAYIYDVHYDINPDKPGEIEVFCFSAKYNHVDRIPLTVEPGSRDDFDSPPERGNPQTIPDIPDDWKYVDGDADLVTPSPN